MSKLMHGPYEAMGDPCADDVNANSFDCQFSSVFKHPERDLYIALGDRWMVESQQIGEKLVPNTRKAGYVWLPIDFGSGLPCIRWHKEWSIDHFPVAPKPSRWE